MREGRSGPDDLEEEVMVFFANQIQEHLLEEAQVVPPRPGHSHPLVVNDEVVPARWQCPADPAAYHFDVGG